jgi:hypothetical protein
MAAGSSQSIVQRLALEGALEIIAQLRTMGQAGEAAIKQIQASTAGAGSGLTKLSTAVAGAKVASTEFSKSTEELGGHLGGLTSIVGQLAPGLAALGAAGVGAAFFEIANSAADATHALENASFALGVTTEQFEGMSYAANQVGISTEDFSKRMGKAMAVIGQAQQEFDKTAAAATDLGMAEQIAAEKGDLSAESARNAAQSAQNNLATLSTALGNAQLAARKAGESYSSVASGAGKAGASMEKTANSADSARLAGQKVAEAQNRLSEGYAAAALASKRATLAEDEQKEALQKTADAAEKALSPMQEFLISVGAVGDAAKKGGEQFYAIVDGLNAISDPAVRADEMLKLFGKGWQEMVPYVEAGSAALRASAEAFTASGAALTPAEEKMANTYLAARNSLMQYVEAVRNIIGDTLTQIWVPLFDSIREFIQNNIAGFREFGQSFVTGVLPVLKTVAAAIGDFFVAVGGLVRGFIAAWDGVTAVLHATSINISGETAAWVIGIGAVTIAVGRLLASFKLIRTILSVLTLGMTFQPWMIGLAAVLVAVGALYTNWDKLQGAVSATDSPLIRALKGLRDVAEAFANGLEMVWGWLERIAGVDLAKQAADAKALADSVAAAAKQADFGARADADAANQQAFAPLAGHAGGGLIRGPGTGTSDSIDIRASAGEFMIRAAAVKKYGVGILAAINSMRFSLPDGFSLGGLVGTLGPPRLGYATGGAIVTQGPSGRVAVDLTWNGAKFGNLMTDAQTAESLVRHARSEAMRSTGPKPGWYQP